MFTKIKDVTRLVFGVTMILGLLGLMVYYLPALVQAEAPTSAEGLNTQIDLVDPNYGLNDVPTEVFIYGSDFPEPPTVKLGSETLQIAYPGPSIIQAIVPAGMIPGTYDMTVEDGAGFGDTLADAYEVLNATTVNDLLSFPEWLWSDPFPLRVGFAQSGVGLLVQSLNPRNTTDEVEVEFHLDSPTGLELGSGYTNLLSPYAVESSEKVVWEPDAEGEYTICAIIDPNNQVNETNEDNNTICRTLTVLPFGGDMVPPVVNSFLIEDDALETAEVDVTLDVMATDYPIPGASGMQAIKFVEFEYILGARKWVRIRRNDTTWTAYATAQVNYPWPLVPTYGMRYMQAWVVDNADNISLNPGVDVIDLLPPEGIEDFVAQHGVVFYRIYLEEGQTLQATLTPGSGDPDLYVWSPTGELHYPNTFVGVETVAVNAQNTGTYQIEVHGYTDAEFSLTFNATAARVKQSLRAGECTDDRPTDRCPSLPAVPLNSIPNYFPDPPAALTYKIYLPMTIR